jgi:zinc transport system substrate-binding protein
MKEEIVIPPRPWIRTTRLLPKLFPRGGGKPRRGLGGALAAVMLAGALGSCASPPKANPVIAASVPPVAALTRMVAGDRLSVISLLPSGRSPHDFEPTPAELNRLRGAVLFVYTGGDADRWMRRSAEGVMGDEARELPMTSVVTESRFEPHLWLNLDVVERFIPVLAESLAAVDPGDAAGYRSRGRAALDSLRAFDAWARTTLDPVKGVPFALTYPAFHWFVQHYGLDLVSIIKLRPETEVLPRDLGHIAARLERYQIKAIFNQPQFGSGEAEHLSRDLNARMADLDPLGGTDRPGRQTYLDLLRWNVRVLAETLGGAKP